MIKPEEIIKRIKSFIDELINITASANTTLNQSLANQRFNRWKKKLLDFIRKDISEEEALKAENLSYPMVMEIRPMQNYNRKIDAYKSYLEVLIEELKSNPETILKDFENIKDIERKKIDMPKDKIKVFISYSNIDKEIAHQVSEKLKEWSLIVFLAHEDIEVSEEWKNVILENLYNCDVFIPMITENFKTSDWTSQEIGIVLGRRENILIVPLKKDNYIPYGFISNFQAKDINTARVELEIIKKIENKYPKSLIKELLNYLYKSRSYRDAEFRLDFVLQCIGETLNKDVLNKILKVALKNENNQILYAAKCKEWLLEQLKNNPGVDEEIFNQFKSLPDYEDEL